jgi:hypothetical protein
MFIGLKLWKELENGSSMETKMDVNYNKLKGWNYYFILYQMHLFPWIQITTK